MNIVWVPYIISETVMAETEKFTNRGKTFAIASINDLKVSVEESVHTFESLQNLQKVPVTFKRKSNVACQPDFCMTFAAYIESLQ